MQDDANAALCVIVDPLCNALLIKRVENKNDPWSGQIAFPGGHRKVEESLLECSLREAYEEVGIRPEGKPEFELGIVAPGNRPEVHVKPFVFRVGSKPDVRINPNEVKEAKWVNLLSLKKAKQFVEGATREVYLVDNWVIWGLTMRVIDDLLRACRKLDSS